MSGNIVEGVRLGEEFTRAGEKWKTIAFGLDGYGRWVATMACYGTSRWRTRKVLAKNVRRWAERP